MSTPSRPSRPRLPHSTPLVVAIVASVLVLVVVLLLAATGDDSGANGSSRPSARRRATTTTTGRPGVSSTSSSTTALTPSSTAVTAPPTTTTAPPPDVDPAQAVTVTVTSCQWNAADEEMQATATATNHSAQEVTANVYVSFVGADGSEIDEDWIPVDLAPGASDTVDVSSSIVDPTTDGAVRCVPSVS